MDLYVIGVDLGTSAVKLLLVSEKGDLVGEVSKSYPLLQKRAGYNEQRPEDWVEATIDGLRELVEGFHGDPSLIKGMSFSGQMHGLVLLDSNYKLLRNAILWNDMRTTKQCQYIYDELGGEALLDITKNPALEGFTLPKLLWVKQHEPEIFERAEVFLLPKDYLRFRLTGKIHMDYSDASGTLLLDLARKEWSREICDLFDLPEGLCPPLIDTGEEVGGLREEVAALTGLDSSISVFAGGADNACGAIGAGILEEGKTLCSIGTSGVILSYESKGDKNFAGKVHYFHHGAPEAYYTMGVTLAAGHSLSWFRDNFAAGESYDELLAGIGSVSPGSEGLLFTPYINGERTPYADSNIRGSFIGMSASHRRDHFARAVLEGITFSLKDSIEIFRAAGKTIDSVISIGGGAKNEVWLQMQADIFNAKVIRLKSEQGPGMGAAMIAAVGSGIYPSLKDCAKAFLEEDRIFYPRKEIVKEYDKIYLLYREIYDQTKGINDQLANFR